MKGNILRYSATVRFKHFQNTPYAIFRSLKVQVNIGVLTVASLAFASADSVSAQNVNVQQPDWQYELEEVEVTGSRVPLTLGQAARMVTVLDREAIAVAPVQSITDLLKYAVGVDVRQRGAIGAQTDISVRGGTFDQITILLNGINIGDPQTGHNAADFPVDISEIERIEVLEGPAGRVYGTSSLVGAINIVTRQESESSADLHAEGGSFGYFRGGGRINVKDNQWNNQLSASFTRSDGYTRNQAGGLNGDLLTLKAFYQGQYDHEQVKLNWHSGVSDKGWGSSTFYATPKWKADDQYEHTRKYYTTVQAETKGFFHFKPAVYWNRSYDRYEGYRGKPELMRYNYNRTDVFGLNLNSYIETKFGKTAMGAEFRNEDLVSGNLGEPLDKPKHIHGTDRDYTLGLNRSNLSLHLEHNVLLNRFTFSAGFIAVKNTWNEMPFKLYPGLDLSYQLGRNWRFYASYNTSLRMPTFTELYYSVGGHKADKYLKPEEMQAVEGGVKYLSHGIRATVSVYHHHGKNMIDWILNRNDGEDAVWTSMNHTKLNALGIETSVLFDFHYLLPNQHFLQSLSLAYNYIDQDKDLEPHLVSNYALEYLRHKLVAQLSLHIIDKVHLHVSYRYQDRVGSCQLLSGETMEYKPYSLLDARLSYDLPQYKIYIEGNNLFNTRYYDFGNVPQPGFWLIAGVSYRFHL
jgi:iron complex outermembrane receptor protein